MKWKTILQLWPPLKLQQRDDSLLHCPPLKLKEALFLSPRKNVVVRVVDYCLREEVGARATTRRRCACGLWGGLLFSSCVPLKLFDV